MEERLIMAGFGGQGVMLMGQLLTYTGLYEDKNVSWLPSYGPEMRGGTANCNVIVSDEPVASPTVTEATTAIVLNRPSLDKFESHIIEGGNLIINSSLIDKKAERDDIKAYYVPANEIANEIGNGKVANMVLLGAYLELSKAVKIESLEETMKQKMTGKKAQFIPMNMEAVKRGAEAVRK